MATWIIEADIYRLQKQIKDSSNNEDRSKLSTLLNQKRARLADLTGWPAPPPIVVPHIPASASPRRDIYRVY